MGAGGGGNYGATKNVVKFMDNLLKVAEYYPMSPSKYFGLKSGNKVRQILSENPLETMWNFVGRLSEGIVEIHSLPGNQAGLQINCLSRSVSSGISGKILFGRHSCG